MLLELSPDEARELRSILWKAKSSARDDSNRVIQSGIFSFTEEDDRKRTADRLDSIWRRLRDLIDTDGQPRSYD